MDSCWKKAFWNICPSPVWRMNIAIIVVEADLHTSLDYLEDLSFHIYKRRFTKPINTCLLRENRRMLCELPFIPEVLIR